MSLINITRICNAARGLSSHFSASHEACFSILLWNHHSGISPIPRIKMVDFPPMQSICYVFDENLRNPLRNSIFSFCAFYRLELVRVLLITSEFSFLFVFHLVFYCRSFIHSQFASQSSLSFIFSSTFHKSQLF